MLTPTLLDGYKVWDFQFAMRRVYEVGAVSCCRVDGRRETSPRPPYKPPQRLYRRRQAQQKTHTRRGQAIAARQAQDMMAGNTDGEVVVVLVVLVVRDACRAAPEQLRTRGERTGTGQFRSCSSMRPPCMHAQLSVRDATSEEKSVVDGASCQRMHHKPCQSRSPAKAGALSRPCRPSAGHKKGRR
jgi:hypothetical protein